MQALMLLDYLAFFFLLVSWSLYSFYSRYRLTKPDNSLIEVTKNLRKHWVDNLLQNANRFRIVDAQVVNILHRGISFFISTTILIIGGLVAMLGSGEAIVEVLERLPYYASNALETWSVKMICMIVIFISAFFRLTWSLRQNQYYTIAMFGAPHGELSNKKNEHLAVQLANLMSDSGKNFNNALRAYYFGLSVLAWLIHPILFIITNLLVLLVIYRREFNSNTLKMLSEINQTYNTYGADDLQKNEIAASKEGV